MQRDYLIGEKKYIDFEVISKEGKPFAITEATWELLSRSGIVQSGECEINGSKLAVLLDPPLEKAKYALLVSYTIPPETRKAKVIIDVG